jgi:hypothetical protein
MKKSQVTLFIIIGIVLILSVFLLMFLKDTEKNNLTEDENQMVLSSQATPQEFENYITKCIESRTKKLIPILALNGATLRDSLNRKYNNISYNYMCTNRPREGCVNELRKREISFELSDELIQKMPACLNLDRLRKEGYNIEEGKMTFSAEILQDKVVMTLDYPIKITKDQVTYSNSKFSATIKTNFGMMYDLSQKIVNDEIENSRFDKENWMLTYGATVQIDKHKPYPDTIYTLTNFNKDTKEFLTFRFATQGDDTVSKIDSPFVNYFLGYCLIEKDNNCFANAPEKDCITKGGIFSLTKPASCGGLSIYDSGCNGTCSDCGDRKHGESWCEYDGPTGNGLDYVGAGIL